jgi:tetratricopeptide (TPR) repeat protein
MKTRRISGQRQEGKVKASWRKYCVLFAAITVIAQTGAFAGDANSVFNQAVADYQAGRWEMAEQRFMQVLALNPTDARCNKYLSQIPYQKGLQLLSLHRYAEGEEQLKLAHSLDPSNAKVSLALSALPYRIGKAQYDQGDSANALSNFTRYAADHPRDAMTHYYMANCLAKRGDLTSAAREYQYTKALVPGTTTASYADAALQAMQGKTAVSGGGIAGAMAFALTGRRTVPAGALQPTLLSVYGNPGQATVAAYANPRKAMRQATRAARASAYAPAPSTAALNSLVQASATPAFPGQVGQTTMLGAAANNPFPLSGNPNFTVDAAGNLIPTNNNPYAAAMQAAGATTYTGYPTAINANGLPAVPAVNTPAVPAMIPVQTLAAGNPNLQQAVTGMLKQSTIDWQNNAKMSQAQQRDQATLQTLEANQITNAYNARYKGSANTAQLQADQQAALDQANRDAAKNVYSSLAWQSNHANMVNQAVNNAQELLADPKSGLQPIGTDLYTRYYGGQAGKPVPEAHPGVLRIHANGAGEKYPDFTTDDDVMTMKQAPKRDVSAQVLPK